MAGRDETTICNEALGELPAVLISSIDDSGQSARHCKRLYQNVVDDLIEAHDWDFAIARAAIAVITNDRSGEWAYAYALPTDLGSPRRLIPAYDGAVSPFSVSGMVGLSEQFQDAIEFRIADGVLYTHLENATLEYARKVTTPALFTSLFARAVVTELAARLVMPILNDRTRQGDLVRQAELAKERAIADDINRNRRSDLDFSSGSAQARGVGFPPYDYRRG